MQNVWLHLLVCIPSYTAFTPAQLHENLMRTWGRTIVFMCLAFALFWSYIASHSLPLPVRSSEFGRKTAERAGLLEGDRSLQARYSHIVAVIWEACSSCPFQSTKVLNRVPLNHLTGNFPCQAQGNLMLRLGTQSCFWWLQIAH